MDDATPIPNMCSQSHASRVIAILDIPTAEALHIQELHCFEDFAPDKSYLQVEVSCLTRGFNA